MSAPDRRDSMWLCSGCVHGFMFTTRKNARAPSFWGPHDTSESSEDPKLVDVAMCYCSNPNLINSIADIAEGDKRPERVHIATQVIACDGFTLKEPKS